MKVQESFEINEDRERVWEFFEQPERVAKCVPGVDSVEVVDENELRLRMTQDVGPMTATFALKMNITERVESESISFTATGRVVQGASGNVRSTNQVRLSPSANGGTRVDLDADIAMGGMLGSVGQKVISKQTERVTKEFVDSLSRVLRGEELPSQDPESEPKKTIASDVGSSRGTAEPHRGVQSYETDEFGEGGVGLGISLRTPDWPTIGAAAVALFVVAWFVGRASGINAAHARMVKARYRR